ncbi:unnamed protein product [Diabrotica balteata]|uniref:Uracil-DNA glycosylase-like domain-containing protein n=1 Tax=Diabrotica balteata TaxID=107213 RepID=A0A9N9SYH6_DIABA|nr:unnamed protein product [Diabrotica balteata]
MANNYGFNDLVKKYPILFENSEISELWQSLLASVLNNKIESLENIVSHLREEPGKWVPSSEKIWTFTKFCCPRCVKVIIVGQDPTFDASGLAFSSRETIYDSTRNVLDELTSDIGIDNLRPFPKDCGNLEYWARQGVLLLNSALTKSINGDSHLYIGWQDITGELIKQLQVINEKLVFMFWGLYARRLNVNVKQLFANNSCNILSAGHPSCRNEKNDFFGCQHFSQANKWLKEHNIDTIDWCPIPSFLNQCVHLECDFGFDQYFFLIDNF